MKSIKKKQLIVVIAALALTVALLIGRISSQSNSSISTLSSAGAIATSCGDCGALCRPAAFDRAAKRPDALIQCVRSRLNHDLGLALLKSDTGTRIWLVGDAFMAPAESEILDAQGHNVLLTVVQEGRLHWPWFFDAAEQPDAAVPPVSAPPVQPQASPSPEGTTSLAPLDDENADSPWVLFATEEALAGTFTGRGDLGDVRPVTEPELNSVLGWIDELWPAESAWRHMAWVDPQCGFCRRLHEEGRVEHWAPRVVLNSLQDPEQHRQAVGAAGWLMGETQDAGRFLAMEPAPEELNVKAAAAQQQFDQMLYQLRSDWDLIVPVQLMHGNGWAVIWIGAGPAPGFIPA